MESKINYNSLVEKSNKYGERNDCAVKALAVVLNTSYEDSHLLNKNFGRKDGKGTSLIITLKALESRGFKFKEIGIGSNFKKNITVKKFEQYYIRKYKNPLLILTARHIAGVNRGKIHDHISGRNVRIKTIYEIIATENAVHSINVNPNKIQVKAINRKKEEFKYAIVHKDTKEIFFKYKRKPGNRVYTALEIGDIWITGKKKETKGKLKIVSI